MINESNAHVDGITYPPTFYHISTEILLRPSLMRLIVRRLHRNIIKFLLLNSVLNLHESVNSEMIFAWSKVLLQVILFAKNANVKIWSCNIQFFDVNSLSYY